MYTSTHVQFGGGGMRGFAYAGLLDELKRKHCIDWGARCPKLESVSGCSIGSIAALLICLGYSSSEILHLVSEIQIQDLFTFDVKLVFAGLTGPFTSEKTLGLDDGSSLRTYIADRIYGKLKHKISRKEAETLTLQQLYAMTDMRLHVVATNVSQKKSVFFQDNVAVVDAVYASCALPPFFAPIRIGGDLYADGGIMDYTFPEGLHFVLRASPSTLPLEERIASATSPMAQWLESIVYLVAKFNTYANAVVIDCGPTPMVQLGDLRDVKAYLIARGRESVL